MHLDKFVLFSLYLFLMNEVMFIRLHLLLFTSALSLLPFQKNITTGCGMLCLGMTLILFPFCTPETYQKLGYLKSTQIGRILGFLIELYALFILFY